MSEQNVEIKLVKITKQAATYQLRLVGREAVFEWTIPSTEYHEGLHSDWFRNNVHHGISLLRSFDLEGQSDLVVEIVNGY